MQGPAKVSRVPQAILAAKPHLEVEPNLSGLHLNSIKSSEVRFDESISKSILEAYSKSVAVTKFDHSKKKATAKSTSLKANNSTISGGSDDDNDADIN